MEQAQRALLDLWGKEFEDVIMTMSLWELRRVLGWDDDRGEEPPMAPSL